MHVRVRRMFLEELGTGQDTDFIDTAQVPDEIDEAYDEAAQEQHLIVLDAAEKTGRLEDHDGKYLRRYLQRWVFRIDRGTVEYGPVPKNMGRIIKLEVDGIRATRFGASFDRKIRLWPSQFGPGRGEVFFVLLAQGLNSPPLTSDSDVRLRVYVYGDTLQDLTVAAPLVQMQGELTFYRLLDPISYNSPPLTYCDVEDPYNDGIIHGVVARLQEKAQQTDRATHHYQMARLKASLIMPPPPGAQGQGQ